MLAQDLRLACWIQVNVDTWDYRIDTRQGTMAKANEGADVIRRWFPTRSVECCTWTGWRGLETAFSRPPPHLHGWTRPMCTALRYFQALALFKDFPHQPLVIYLSPYLSLSVSLSISCWTVKPEVSNRFIKFAQILPLILIWNNPY